MNLAMVSAAKGNYELIAHLATQPAALCKAQLKGIPVGTRGGSDNYFPPHARLLVVPVTAKMEAPYSLLWLAAIQVVECK
jgi:hypothetical protein